MTAVEWTTPWPRPEYLTGHPSLTPGFVLFWEFVRARSRPYRRVFRRPIRHFAAFFVLFLMRWLKFLKKVIAMAEIHEKVVAMAEIPKKVIAMAEIL